MMEATDPSATPHCDGDAIVNESRFLRLLTPIPAEYSHRQRVSVSHLNEVDEVARLSNDSAPTLLCVQRPVVLWEAVRH
jgi:hypothetical protein